MALTKNSGRPRAVLQWLDREGHSRENGGANVLCKRKILRKRDERWVDLGQENEYTAQGRVEEMACSKERAGFGDGLI